MVTQAADLAPPAVRFESMLEADLDAILVIERSTFAEDAWSRGMFLRELKIPFAVCLVLRAHPRDETVAGAEVNSVAPAKGTVGRVGRNDVTPAKAGVQSQMEGGNAGSPSLDPGIRRDDDQAGGQLLGRSMGSGADVLGYVCWRELGDEWEILNVAVSPDARRRGLGTLLVRRVLGAAVAKAAAKVHLEVREDNVAAVSLYLRCEFFRSGLRRHYYGRDRNAVLMTWGQQREKCEEGDVDKKKRPD